MQRSHQIQRPSAQRFLRVLCLGCALLLIALSLNGRTVWMEGVPPSPHAALMRDAAGWDWLARGAGIVVIIALCIGLWSGRQWVRITSAAVALGCSGWAAYVAWRYSADIAQGLVVRSGWSVQTPPHLESAVRVAACTSVLALVLMLVDLRPARQTKRHRIRLHRVSTAAEPR